MESLELIARAGQEIEEKEANSSSVSTMSDGRTSQGSTLAEEEGRQRKAESGPRRNPPARNTSRFWFERFLAVIQRQNPSLIDSSFLSQIAPNNEGKLLAQLKFLRLIDDQGKPTALLPVLNMVGAEQKKGFQQVIRESYEELLAEIVVEKAVVDDIVNYFIRKYAFTRDKAVHATKFFLYLAEKGSLGVSPELSSFLTEKIPNGSAPSPSSSNTSSGMALPRIAVDKAPRIARESTKGYTSSSSASRFRSEYDSPLQTIINIKLDKDTPKEYWDRVLALMGERRNGDGEKSPISAESPS